MLLRASTMAAARDMAALGDAVVQAAAQIQELGSDWYRASAEWNAFPLLVERLSRERDIWHHDLAKLGVSLDPSLMRILKDAKSSMEGEAAKLKKKRSDKSTSPKSWVAGCWSMPGMAVFPVALGQGIETVIQALDDIHKQLALEEEEAAAAFETRQLSRLHPLPFRKDVGYVPLVASESAIRDALTEQDGPDVVLLHGAAGTGKSTLARAVALEFEAAGEASEFEHVVYVECGPESNTDTVHLKLLRQLGSSPCPSEEQFLPLRRGSASNWAIPKRLRFLVGDRMLLIVLDDICSRDLLRQTIELCGRGVKCLVTAHSGELCHDMNCSWIGIPMEDVRRKDARKILASHVGFSDQCVPPELEDVVDEMIVASGSNPLALATIAKAIDIKRSREPDAWEAASRTFFSSVHCENTAYVLSRGYPKCFWSAMQVTFASLQPDVQKVLVLLHSCKGPSVPEEIVRIFYHVCYQPEKGIALLEKLRMQLEIRELVKVAESRKRISWSVHSLQQKFIQEEKNDLRESAFALILGGANASASPADIVKDSNFGVKETVVDTLGALYFDQQFAGRMAAKMGIPVDSFALKRRDAIEPVTRLLGRPLGVSWTKRQRDSAGEVLWKYICTGTFDDRDVEDLLGSPVSVLAMLNALRDIGAVEGKIVWLNDGTQNFVNSLLAIFQDLDTGGKKLFHSDPDLQDESVYPLGDVLARLDDETRLKIVNSDEFLGKLVQLLAREHNIELQWLAIKSLRILLEVDNSRLRLLQFPGTVEELAEFLSERRHFCQSVRYVAVELIANLAQGLRSCTEDVKRLTRARLNEVHDLPDSLEALLADQVSSSIQFPAALALTLICTSRANRAQLYSGTSFCGRGHSNMLLGLFEESLADLNRAMEHDDLDNDALRHEHDVFVRHIRWVLLSDRSFVKAKLQDFEGSLADADKAIAMECTPVGLRERGVLKRMMGDLDGALADLNRGLPMDAHDYEMVKHRGYVKFLMGDEKGARADATSALKLRPSYVDGASCRPHGLSATSVEFLEYSLK